MRQQYPEMMQAYEEFGEATECWALTPKEVALIKLAISIGAGLEGGAKSHARKAIEMIFRRAKTCCNSVRSKPWLPTMMRKVLGTRPSIMSDAWPYFPKAFGRCVERGKSSRMGKSKASKHSTAVLFSITL